MLKNLKEKLKMRKTTIETLEKDELIFGSPTAGKWFVRRYEDDVEMGGGFFKTKKEAQTHVREYKKSK